MYSTFRTVRFRLAVLNMSVFAVLLGGGSLAMLTAGQRYFEHHFDERLGDRAEAMANKIRVTDDHRFGMSDPTRDRLNPFRFPGYFFQIRDLSGQVLERSRNLGPVELPADPAAAQLREDGDRCFSTVGGEVAQRLLGSPGEVRLLTLLRRSERDGRFVLQVALSRRLVADQIDDLRALLIGLVSVGLVLAGFASWLLARRALAPIGEIAAAAERLGGDDLTRRFEPPSGRDEISAMVRTINRMLDRLQWAFDSQASFISNVSHELKTPLAVLLGSAQVILQKRRSEEEYRRFASEAEQEIRALSATVEGLLVLAQADAGAPMTDAARLSVNEIVMEAVYRSEAHARERQVRLVPQLNSPSETEPEALVWADPELLRIALGNLLRNAVRHSPEGAAVEVLVEADAAEVRIVVRDEGPGIADGDLELIFEKFRRGPTPEGSAPGAGLGLTIARSVVQLHEGRLTAANPPEGGACFTTTLPRIRPSSPETLRMRSNSPPT